MNSLLNTINKIYFSILKENKMRLKWLSVKIIYQVTILILIKTLIWNNPNKLNITNTLTNQQMPSIFCQNNDI